MSQCRDGRKCHRSLKEKNTVTKAKSLFLGGFEIFPKESFHRKKSLVSRIERKYCLISTSYLVVLFDIFKLLHS